MLNLSFIALEDAISNTKSSFSSSVSAVKTTPVNKNLAIRLRPVRLISGNLSFLRRRSSRQNVGLPEGLRSPVRLFSLTSCLAFGVRGYVIFSVRRLSLGLSSRILSPASVRPGFSQRPRFGSDATGLNDVTSSSRHIRPVVHFKRPNRPASMRFFRNRFESSGRHGVHARSGPVGSLLDGAGRPGRAASVL